MKKILFLHGFYASGQCVPAVALREAFAGKADVLTPDLPMHPQDTLAHFEPLFLTHYSHSFHFPGAHTPTAPEVRTWYVPLAEQLLTHYTSL